MRGFQALCSLSLGEAHLLAGRLEEAHALAERALALAREHQERGHQAYALRLLGEIAAHREPLEVAPAEAHYQQALALAEELGMRPLQAHCHRGLGTLYAKTGQREQARAALSTAIALYRGMEMTFWLPQTEATLAEVGADVGNQGKMGADLERDPTLQVGRWRHCWVEGASAAKLASRPTTVFSHPSPVVLL